MTSCQAETKIFWRKVCSFIDSGTETEQKFLEFVEIARNNSIQYKHMQNEVIRLQSELNQKDIDCKSLKMKLQNSKVMLDEERTIRKQLEFEKKESDKQIALVVNLLGKGDVNNETIEKLQMLSSTFNGRNSMSDMGQISLLKDVMSPNALSIINENDDSNVYTVSDVDMTEGDELEISTTRSGRTYRRSSQKREPSTSPDKVPRKKSCGEAKKNLKNTALQDLTNQRKMAPQSIMHAMYPPVPSAPFLADENVSPPFFESPIKMPNHQSSVKVIQVNTPGGGLYSSPTNSPRNYSTSRLNSRPHSFVPKSIYWTEFCQPCGKRIMFGKVSHKCKECKSTCHPECQDMVPLPCIPTITGTPAKSLKGLIADFAPKLPPMVPAIVVHCTNEVENRGLNEIGIYRVPGSDKDVKELKDRFMRGKGTPSLTKCDIFVICGAVKDFLRNLKEPLVTFTLWRDFVSASEKTDQEGQACLFQAISDLPQPNRDTLAWMLCHLQRVAECVECKMPVANLAKVFGPTIVGYSSSEIDIGFDRMLDETRKQQKVMEKLLEISNDYWRTFVNVNTTPFESFHTPEITKRRRSLLSITPMHNRNCETPRRQNSRK